MKIYTNGIGIYLVNSKKGAYIDPDGSVVYSDKVNTIVPDEVETITEISEESLSEALKILK